MKVANSVDMGVAVVQVMVACKPSPCIVAFWIRSVSYSVTPEQTLLRHAGRSAI